MTGHPAEPKLVELSHGEYLALLATRQDAGEFCTVTRDIQGVHERPSRAFQSATPGRSFHCCGTGAVEMSGSLRS
jgi:hypothetical protein